MEKFSIILLYYNQKNYINEAIDSILCQNYSNIELIICDDGSDLDISKTDKYIKNKNKKIEVKFLKLKKNIGTVKITNLALSKVSGKYFLIFAADDKLYDEKVVNHFITAFNNNLEIDIISSQCILYDRELKKVYSKYVDVNEALLLNTKEPIDLFKILCKKCVYAAGATAYRSCLINDKQLIPEDYILVEDLSLWLDLTLKGKKIKYIDFVSLCHRDGGVSKSDEINNVSETQKIYYNDILKIKENFPLKNINLFSLKEQKDIIDDYRNYLNFISNKIPSNKNIYELKIRKIIYSKWWYLLLIFKRKLKRKISTLKSQIKNFVYNYYHYSFKLRIKKSILEFAILILWILLNIVSCIYLKNKYLIFLFFIINFFISSILTKIILLFWRKYAKK